MILNVKVAVRCLNFNDSVGYRTEAELRSKVTDKHHGKKAGCRIAALSVANAEILGDAPFVGESVDALPLQQQEAVLVVVHLLRTSSWCLSRAPETRDLSQVNHQS